MPLSSQAIELRRSKVRSAGSAAFLAGAWLALACSTSAQITRVVDEHGKTVFVNADSPKPHRGSTISSPPASSPVAAATSSPLIVNPFPGSETSFREPKSVDDPVAPKPIETKYDNIIARAAERHHVDAALVKAVITQESGWNPQAISRKGAVGLMQLIPSTAQRYGAHNSFDPAQNVEAGTSYLKSLLDRYDNDLLKTLAAYNAGENAVDRNGGVPAYPETQKYVRKVSNQYFGPSSGRDTSLWSPPRIPLRKSVDANGRVTFSNE
jgi:soluble lytic murein transglycosylase-like protein